MLVHYTCIQSKQIPIANAQRANKYIRTKKFSTFTTFWLQKGRTMHWYPRKIYEKIGCNRKQLHENKIYVRYFPGGPMLQKIHEKKRTQNSLNILWCYHSTTAYYTTIGCHKVGTKIHRKLMLDPHFIFFLKIRVAAQNSTQIKSYQWILQCSNAKSKDLIWNFSVTWRKRRQKCYTTKAFS